MGMPNLGEVLIIVFIVLLVFGAAKLPALGEALGKSIRGFKRGAGGGDERAPPDDDRPVS